MDIYRRGIRPYGSMNLRVGFRAYPTQGVLIADPDPRVYLAAQATRVATLDEAILRMGGGYDFHRAPLVEGSVLAAYPLPSHWFATGSLGLPAGEARIIAFAPETLSVESTSSTPALLVLAEAWFPGWRAWIDGKEAPCFPVNAWMRAVPVPAGRHQVEFQFTTPGLLLGSLLSLAALAILLVLFRLDPRQSPWRRQKSAGEMMG